jgi:hypothetical protein
VKQQILYESINNELTFRIRDYGLPVVPDTVTLSIYNQYGSQVVEDESITPNATTGVCSYTVPSTLTDELAENLRAEWTITVSGETSVYNQLFDVVLTKILPEIIDADLISDCSALANGSFVYFGKADSGSVTTLVDSRLAGYPVNYWKSARLEILSGGGAGIVVQVESYNETTGTLTFNTISEAVDSTTEFTLKRSFAREINRAWDQIMGLISQKGYRPALLTTGEVLKNAHLYLALEKVCRSLSNDPEDIWWRRADFYREEYQNDINSIRFVYDSNEDGTPDTEKGTVLEFRR